MNSIPGYDKWLTTPPDDDPTCEDGCGDTLEKDIEGNWVCVNRFCPTQFEEGTTERDMAEALVEYMDKAKDVPILKRRYLALDKKHDDLKQEIADLTILCKQWQEMYYKMTYERDELEYKLDDLNR